VRGYVRFRGVTWGYVKNPVDQVKHSDLRQLQARTRDVATAITHNMLQNTWTEAECRLDICRAAKHAYIEI